MHRERTGIGLHYLIAWGACTLLGAALAQAAERTPRVHALEHARVVVRPGAVVEDATIVLRDGVIEAVGPGIAVPADARVWDLSGRTVYAGFVEPWWDRAPASDERRGRRGRGDAEPPAVPAATRGAVHENPLVHPENDVATTLEIAPDDLKEMRSLGYTVAHVVPSEGVFRGASAVVTLRDGTARQQILQPQSAQVLSFERNRRRGDRPAGYPNSKMGSVALVRQTLLDAGWSRECEQLFAKARGALPPPEGDESLESVSVVLPRWGRKPVWVRTDDVLDLLRAASVLSEFGLAGVLLGSGDEYRRLDDVRATGLQLVLPVDFPDPPRFEDEDEALSIGLETLQHWARAPENPARVQQAGIPFAITSHGLHKRSALHERIRSAVQRGWSADAALGALTTVPAQLLGLDSRIGTVEKGKLADLTVTDGDLFADKVDVVEVWADGDRYEILPKGDPLEKLRGDWQLTVGSGSAASRLRLHVEGTSALTLRVWVESDAGRRKADRAGVERDALVARIGGEGLRLAPEGRQLTGTWRPAAGKEIPARAARRRGGVGEQGVSQGPGTGATPETESTATAALAGFAWPPAAPPAPPAVLVRGATIWTCSPQGVLENADLLAVDGKIRAVGRGLTPPRDAVVVDARGKHLTPGIIDCHSHSDIVGGVNESSNICTAEVRIADVVNSESIAIYRELAGGVTVSNQLHGSANSIGGQNAVIKLRWGAAPQGLLLKAAPPGIKFALGENPKQSNWGKEATGRYPQTRMGVEESIRERFLAARDYQRAWDEWKKGKGSKPAYPPRRDLQLETIAEILRGERLVHCHAYRADEILMLMRLAEEFGFRIATFQHVLEGYKVADELAAHGAGASCFSDWWAYKFEVYDAIPYAGAIMHDRGVVVSFNSDSSELARHLYVEAAKAVKYGGVPETEALDFVTLNPAKQLRIDARVGSLEPGKDADFALWNESPLSSTTRCEQTWIEGRRYFDRETDRTARATAESERQRLLAAARSTREAQRDREDGGEGSWRPSYWSAQAASCHEEVQP